MGRELSVQLSSRGAILNDPMFRTNTSSDYIAKAAKVCLHNRRPQRPCAPTINVRCKASVSYAALTRFVVLAGNHSGRPGGTRTLLQDYG